MSVINTYKNFECAICLNVYDYPPSLKSPKTLSCSHSFCSSCLGELYKNNRKINCPTCRRTTNFVVDIPVDMKIIKEMREFNINSNTQTNIICDNCEVDPSLVKCITCMTNLCSQCLSYHNALKTNRAHVVMNIKDIEDKNITISKEVNKDYCKEHKDNEIIYFCDNCRVGVCNECTIRSHPPANHNLLSLNDAVSKYCKGLPELLETVPGLLSKLNETIDTNIEKIEEINYIKLSKEAELTNLFDNVIARVNNILLTHRDELINDFNSFCQPIEKILAARVNDVELKLRDLNISNENALKCLNNGTVIDSINSHNNINACVNGIKSYYQSYSINVGSFKVQDISYSTFLSILEGCCKVILRWKLNNEIMNSKDIITGSNNTAGTLKKSSYIKELISKLPIYFNITVISVQQKLTYVNGNLQHQDYKSKNPNDKIEYRYQSTDQVTVIAMNPFDIGVKAFEGITASSKQYLNQRKDLGIPSNRLCFQRSSNDVLSALSNHYLVLPNFDVSCRETGESYTGIYSPDFSCLTTHRAYSVHKYE